MTGSNADYDELLDAVGESGFVLLGEATHGASEFYSERARMTRRLVENKGFTVVIIEANWPDAYDVNESYTAGARRVSKRPWRRSTASQVDVGQSRVRRTLVVDAQLQHAARPRTPRPPIRHRPLQRPGVDGRCALRCCGAIVWRQRHGRRPATLLRAVSSRGHGAVRAAGRGWGGRSCEDAAAAQFAELTKRALRVEEGARPGDDHLISAWQNARVVTKGEEYDVVVYIDRTTAVQPAGAVSR